MIELAYFGGFSHSEIAEMLSMPLGTVKGRMRLGLEKIRVQIAESITPEGVLEADMSEPSTRDDGSDDRAAHGERWNDDLAAYALDALDPAETRARRASTWPAARSAPSDCAGWRRRSTCCPPRWRRRSRRRR